MPVFGDNPFDDGLDFVGCPPERARLRLPKFPENFSVDCKLICWGRCSPHPDGERMMQLVIDDFEPDPHLCGVYNGEVHFIDQATGEEWYRGELKFYYTRNYEYSSAAVLETRRKSIAFRFVAKGDIQRVSDKMPEWRCFILCTKRSENVKWYENIFVYGGLDILYDPERERAVGLMLALGHNDGWFTHHPRCSRRPIDSAGLGDYIGHYCDRGWLFVSPGRSFVFDPRQRPPTGRFSEEAIREVGRECRTEDATRYGWLEMTHTTCLNCYQLLKGYTECNETFGSVESCQGVVPSGDKQPWITFFSMGYWMDRYQRKVQILHLVEGTIKSSRILEEYRKGAYFYGFATQNYSRELKLVDLASNKDVIGEPADSRLLMYLYNAGPAVANPKVRKLLPLDLKLSTLLQRKEIEILKEKEICPFLQEGEEVKKS
ncbi:MAG: hypothetical protein GKC10_00710 [Methanosarcinales archaeon]|nr:hypothetical protein [Methanosarcinales archaeon]